MKRTSKVLIALLLVFSLFTLSSCDNSNPIPKVSTVEELVGYVNLYLKYPMKHPEVVENKKYSHMDALILSCERVASQDTSDSSIVSINFELASEDGCAKAVLSAILEFITDNLDNYKFDGTSNFPEVNAQSEIAIWEYWTSRNELLSIIVVRDCSCGCNGELWLLYSGKTAALMKVSVN